MAPLVCALFRGGNNKKEQGFFLTYCRDQIIADPEKCFQELISEKLQIFFAGCALLGINYRFQQFSGFTPLAGQITGIGLKAINSSKKVLKIHWEIKGRFRKRVVLANVPSFRFSFRGNIRQNHPFGNHPFANPRKITGPALFRINSVIISARTAFGVGGPKTLLAGRQGCNPCKDCRNSRTPARSEDFYGPIHTGVLSWPRRWKHLAFDGLLHVLARRRRERREERR